MTAISVSRDCGMVPQEEKIILISHKFHQSSVTTNSETDVRPSIQFEIVGEPKGLNFQCQNHSHISITMSSTLVNEKYCFALDGKTWNVIRTHYPDLLPRVLTKGKSVIIVLTAYLKSYFLLCCKLAVVLHITVIQLQFLNLKKKQKDIF